MRVRIGIVGVTGYSGLELVKIALRHPGVECAAILASEGSAGKPVAEIHPELRGVTSLVCLPQDAEGIGSHGLDTVFLATPNEISYELVPKLLDQGMRVIDLSGSFRLRDVDSYSPWYGFHHEAPQLLRLAVYGLPEWNAASLGGARLVANPGCYPTSVLLPLLPLVRSGMLEPGSDIFCDAKSGVTGAGRAARQDMLFAEVSGNFRPYSPINHRHAPEICQELGWDLASFTFVPHLLPVNRGIFSTLYLTFHHPVSSEELEAVYRRRYEGHPFVRILGGSRLPELRGVNHTNFCDIGWRLSNGGRRAVVFSALDNLIKGAAGQAVQNFNLMHGLDETVGLLEGEGVAVHG